MSSITQKDMIDEAMNLKNIDKTLKNQNYKDLFLFLEEHFKKDTSIGTTEIACHFQITHYSRAFQLLESFVRLNLLKKHYVHRREVLFLKHNEHFWESSKKRLE